MMKAVNIPSYKTDDPNYRYKMPKLIAKVEGRGNGIRTNIVNMGEIARALKRPPEYPTKFCGHELGSQSKFDPSEGKAIINGSHEQKDLQFLIDKFIEKFVLCDQCKLPEIDLSLKKNRIMYACNACGYRGAVDNSHKLTTFIMRNPPDAVNSTLGTKKKNKERHKEKSSKSKSHKLDDSQDNESEELNDVTQHKQTKDKAKKKCDTEVIDGGCKVQSLTNDSTCVQNNSDIPDTPAIQNKFQVKTKEKKIIDKLNFDSSKVIEEIDKLVTILVSLSAQEKLSGYSDHMRTESFIFNQLRLLQRSPNMTVSIIFYIALKSLFHIKLGGFDIKTLENYTNLLKQITEGMNGNEILNIFEIFLDQSSLNGNDSANVNSCYSEYPYVLQKLYNDDIVDEDTMINHYSQVSTKNEDKNVSTAYTKARIAGQPFLDWLMQSDAKPSALTEET